MPKTVWSKNSMPLVPSRFRSIYTILLPIIDVGLVVFGLSSMLLGSKIVGDFTIPIFLPLWASLLLFGGLLAFLGLVFLRQKVELVGQSAAIVGLVVYAGLTILYIVGGTATAVLTLVLVAIRIAASLWRFFDLLGDLQREEARKVIDTGGIATKGEHSSE